MHQIDRPIRIVRKVARVTKFRDEKTGESFEVQLTFIVIEQMDRGYVVNANVAPIVRASANVQNHYRSTKMLCEASNLTTQDAAAPCSKTILCQIIPFLKLPQ